MTESETQRQDLVLYRLDEIKAVVERVSTRQDAQGEQIIALQFRA